jgi:hypothetical protein
LRCENRKCPGSLHIGTDDMIKEKEQHNHEPGYSKADATAIHNEIAKRAQTTKERPCDIISHFLSTENQHLSHKLSRISALVNSITKMRKKSGIFISKKNE